MVATANEEGMLGRRRASWRVGESCAVEAEQYDGGVWRESKPCDAVCGEREVGKQESRNSARRGSRSPRIRNWLQSSAIAFSLNVEMNRPAAGKEARLSSQPLFADWKYSERRCFSPLARPERPCQTAAWQRTVQAEVQPRPSSLERMERLASESEDKPFAQDVSPSAANVPQGANAVDADAEAGINTREPARKTKKRAGCEAGRV